MKTNSNLSAVLAGLLVALIAVSSSKEAASRSISGGTSNGGSTDPDCKLCDDRHYYRVLMCRKTYIGRPDQQAKCVEDATLDRDSCFDQEGCNRIDWPRAP